MMPGTVSKLLAPPRRSRKFAYLLLLPIIAIFARLTLFIRQRSGEFYSAVDAAAMIQVGLIGLLCCILLICPLKNHTFRTMRGTASRAFLWFFVLCALSAIWSPMPEFSLYRAVEFLSQYFALFVALLYFEDFKNSERLVLWVTTVSILLMVAVNVRFYGLSLSLNHWHTNTYSAAAAMMFCYVVGEVLSKVRKNDKRLYFFGAFSLFFLIIGTSGGSNVAAVCGLVVVGILCRNFKLVFFTVAAGLVGYFLIDWQTLFSMFFPGKSIESVQTMTGRIGLWELYFRNFWEEPFFGSGFAVTARLAENYNINMHNGAIGALFSVGFVGMFFYAGGLLRLLREFLMVQKNLKPGGVGCAAAITAGLANNMTISIFGEQWALPSLAFVVFLVLHTYVNKGVWTQSLSPDTRS